MNARARRLRRQRRKWGKPASSTYTDLLGRVRTVVFATLTRWRVLDRVQRWAHGDIRTRWVSVSFKPDGTLTDVGPRLEFAGLDSGKTFTTVRTWE